MNEPQRAQEWPELPYAAWQSTRDALHMWSQIIGKTVLARAPAQNHWWHAAFRVSSRGLASPQLVAGDRAVDLELDLVDHVLAIRTSDGRTTAIPLFSRTVRSFYVEYVAVLRALGLEPNIRTTPVEVPNPVPFDEDDAPREYDPEWAHRFWQVLRRCDVVLKQLADGYVGKQSPVHFFWGSFDLAATRFSGRRAPERPGADLVTREAYSHEVISFGFWPGGAAPSGVVVEEPVLYAYAAPEPEGFRAADLRVRGASYDARLGEFLLPYDAVRATPDPAAAVRAFCESAYVAGATLGGWPRGELERGTAQAATKSLGG